eukprot:10891501-Heterocapsa_arctica.AAC.1
MSVDGASSARLIADIRDDPREAHDHRDDYSESATSGEIEMPERLIAHLANIPVAERGDPYHYCYCHCFYYY